MFCYTTDTFLCFRFNCIEKTAKIVKFLTIVTGTNMLKLFFFDVLFMHNVGDNLNFSLEPKSDLTQCFSEDR